MESLSLGEKITLLRNRKSLSKRALSEITGIHWITLGKYEQNKMAPSIEAIKKIANALEISVDYLLFNDYKEKNTTSITDKELLELIEKVNCLSEKDKNRVKSFLRSYAEDIQT